MISIKPASRFVNEQSVVMYTKVTREPWGIDLTWRNCTGLFLDVGMTRRYIPFFFWRRLK